MKHLDDEALSAYLDGQLTPGASQLTPGASQLTPGASQLTPGASQLTPGASPGFTDAGLPGSPGSRPGWVEAGEHLAECAECQARLEALRVTRDRAKAILRSGAPSGAQPSFQDVLSRKRQKAAEGGRRIGGLRSLAWAASIVLALSVGWYTRELQLRPSAPQMVELRASAETAGRRDGGTAAKAAEAANVVAERKDQQPPTPIQLAAEPQAAQPPSRLAAVAPTVAADQLKKEDIRDTMTLRLDEVVVTSLASAEAKSAEAPALVARRARSAAGSSAAPAAPAAPARGFAAADAAAEWTRVDLSAASRTLGRAPLIAPGLEIIQYEVGQSGVRVTQRMATGILELIERRADSRDEAGPSASRAVSGPGVGALVDGIQLRLTGPVSYDSLRALVGKLR